MIIYLLVVIVVLVTNESKTEIVIFKLISEFLNNVNYKLIFF